MEILADWLVFDVYNIDSWANWINDDNYDQTISNATVLRKAESTESLTGFDVLVLSSVGHMMQSPDIDKYETPEDQMIIISKQNALTLLKSWQKLRAVSPLEILISTEDEDEFKMFEMQIKLISHGTF